MALRHGLLKVRFEIGLRMQFLVHGPFEKTVCPASIFLRTIHRDIGRAEHAVGIWSVCGATCDANACADVRTGRAYEDRFPDCAYDAIGQTHRIFQLIKPVRPGDNGELVATKAGHRVALADDLRQPTCRLAQNHVTYRMALQVVDGLEAIEIDHEYPIA